jgi:hypothetical protein
MSGRPFDPASADRRVNPLLVAGAVVGVVLIAALVAIVLTRGADEPVAGQSSAPSPSEAPASAPEARASASVAQSASPEPTEAAGPPSIAWEEAAPFEGQPEELMLDGDTWIAVGWASERGPGAWTSLDALSWEPADVVDPMPDDMFRGSGLGPTVRLGDSLLSYGTFIGCCDGRGVLGWRSADGRSWDVIESDSPLFQMGYVVNELVAGDPALVAVEGTYAPYQGRIWRWTEDTSWVETTPGGPHALDDPSGMLTSDVTWADGRYVVVGARGSFTGEAPVTGTSWASTDGETWEESPASAELDDVILFQVAPAPGGGFVAIGTNQAADFGGSGVPLAFTSPDGLAWTPAEMPASAAQAMPVEIVEIDGGLAAIGSANGASTVVWTSADGLSWTDAGGFDGNPTAAAAHAGLLVVTTVGTPEDLRFRLYRGTIVP